MDDLTERQRVEVKARQDALHWAIMGTGGVAADPSMVLATAQLYEEYLTAPIRGARVGCLDLEKTRVNEG